MATTERQILYDPRRAIEHVQTLPGITPIRLFAILFPVWHVETTTTQEQGRPYELIERYIERSIEDAALYTVRDIADFLGLDSKLVEKILLFLETIGHVTSSKEIWSLTPLGRKSVQEGKKYTSKEARHILYFDGFYSQPLLQEHYNNRLHILSEGEADEMSRLYSKGARGYKFSSLFSLHPWRPEMLSALERRTNRSHYNLPEELHGLQPLNVMQVYLPIYIIEARKQSGPSTLTQYIAYTHVKGRRDEFFEHIINSSRDISLALAVEQGMEANELWSSWLKKKGLHNILPQQLANGIWQVVLPKEAFRTEQTELSIASIGTYHLERGYFLQIWCDDVQIRREAALDRTLKIIQKRRKSITKTDIEENLHIFANQLRTRDFYLEDVRQRAVETGMKDVLSILSGLR